ncbi:exported protein of unknown function [Candidatus Nitrosotalea okcheonensis]|uniref:Uncharacterized protein n=1 Tax=Candidatus Nitrosotalea okcheonensis TaxID=1903276 RepID=A0A2H1FEQ2_9ARCH|nr:exported protein of unknown function [Candidatus Nitrosotalea okcheonensis]
MIPVAIAITLIIIVGMGLIMQQQSQSLTVTQKENDINTIHNIREKENIMATYSGSSFSFKNPENVPVHIKYFRIVDDQGHLIARIPYDKQIPAFTNSSINLNGVIPLQYLK